MGRWAGAKLAHVSSHALLAEGALMPPTKQPAQLPRGMWVMGCNLQRSCASRGEEGEAAAHLDRHTVHGARGEGAQSEQRCEYAGTRFGVSDRSDRAQRIRESHFDVKLR